jgi:hypothetical protein
MDSIRTGDVDNSKLETIEIILKRIRDNHSSGATTLVSGIIICGGSS